MKGAQSREGQGGQAALYVTPPTHTHISENLFPGPEVLGPCSSLEAVAQTPKPHLSVYPSHALTRPPCALQARAHLFQSGGPVSSPLSAIWLRLSLQRNKQGTEFLGVGVW